eukprot:Nitzschia sp. Nitz4//scaffold116_size91068//11601//24470//NITZ4_004949-RA/size91068-processed-gene-0.22-mRNA-1//1//CDS//3329533551//6851//frame0
MAPILTGEVGIAPQIIDDERLLQLRKSLTDLKLLVPLRRSDSTTTSDRMDSILDDVPPVNVERLVQLLEPWRMWDFEEQVDLLEWMNPLNKIDACLSYYIRKYPALLLIQPGDRSQPGSSTPNHKPPASATLYAESLASVKSVPPHVIQHLGVLLQFLAGLLANSSNKVVFNSAEELVDLLAAAEDSVSSAALQALCSLATPPVLHKQQAPEAQQHTTALHSSRTESHKRLMTMAKGWGTKGSGLGLFSCATADDSEFGQGALPQDAGELYFSFFQASPDKEATTAAATVTPEHPEMISITLRRRDIVDDSGMTTDSVRSAYESDESSASMQKRRRMAHVPLGEDSIRSTAELFFECLQKAGGRQNIPPERLFLLLADIRLARSFHCRATRIAAIQRRLSALIAILYSHPSQEIMSGYFQAQPELFVELIDLLRPTVSAASVSASSSHPTSEHLKQDSIATLAESPVVPYDIRELALQSLTALVARRDGTTGALTGVARHSNVLAELGVAKGQYLGLLPTLIRFSLTALGSLIDAGAESKAPPRPAPPPEQSPEETLALDIGLAFVEATLPAPMPRSVQAMRALEFVDSVLTLTSSVVSTPAGTTSLTDSGLIPALLGTVQMDHEDIVAKALPEATSQEVLRIRSLLRFVTAQAVAIVEGAIVTHYNALAAFHDLNGVEVLAQRLAREVRIMSDSHKNRPSNSTAMDCDGGDTEMTSVMGTNLQCSQRVLLFSIVTCLTVVVHQESASSTVVVPAGAAELRKTELSQALLTLLENTSLFGGHLASLGITLLSDVMNSDPHVVRHVHECGLAATFLRFFADGANGEPRLPAVPELIMAVPNILSALALTEDGAKVIKEANPFPALLKLFYHPKYAMPFSKCLLNETTAIVGTGLDEMMRHVNSLKPLICEAIAKAMNKVADIGEDLARREKELPPQVHGRDSPASVIENERTCLMQYTMNFGQVLEQILHNDDHSEPFVTAGGLDAALRLFPLLMPTGMEFLSHVSCLSCPSVSTLGHSTTEDSMMLAFKCIALRYKSAALLKIVVAVVETQLQKLVELREEMNSSASECSDGLDASFVLSCLPTEPVYSPTISAESTAMLPAATRVRTEEGYEERALDRQLHPKSKELRYRLRIVCPEGAVVRDGIEIDSCASVGSMEMCEITDAFDRCVNSSGVLRYRTHRGWISEQTRGHGREPIAEVLSVWEAGRPDGKGSDSDTETKNRIETGIPDIRTTGANILARLQTSYTELFSALSKAVVESVRHMPVRSASIQPDTIGGHVAATTRLLYEEISEGFRHEAIRARIANAESEGGINTTGTSMYLGCLLSHVRSCLFEEKRERLSVNIPLLLLLCDSDVQQNDSIQGKSHTFLDAANYVFEQALVDFDSLSSQNAPDTSASKRRLNRATAASLPAVILLLKQLASGPSITSCPASSVLSRVRLRDLSLLLGNTAPMSDETADTDDPCFSPEKFSREVLCKVSESLRRVWIDPRLASSPPHVTHPLLTLIGEVMFGLDDATKKPVQAVNPRRSGARLLEAVREIVGAARNNSNDDFEPTEEAITSMMEMGFSRDHAWDAIERTRSNQVEVAMEYALAHPPPDHNDVERRQNELAERRRQRTQEQEAATAAASGNNDTQAEPAAEMEVEEPATDSQDQHDTSDLSIETAKTALAQWKNDATRIPCSILSRLNWNSTVDSKVENGDVEALTVVLCTFMLDVCQRYPEERDSMTAELFASMRSKLKTIQEGGVTSVKNGEELSFSALCHSAVLISRALPKARIALLSNNVVGPLVGCIRSALGSLERNDKNGVRCPAWLSQSLLLLDILAQPVVAFNNDEDADSSSAENGGELYDVREEHKRQTAEMSQLARDLASALGFQSIPGKDSSVLDTDSPQDQASKLFDVVPAYFPLLPPTHAQTCVDICVQVLRLKVNSPGTINAALFLLMRLLRSPSLSSYCIHAGVSDCILGLPRKVRFTGHTGLITHLLRRLLEDDHSLQLAMETEICGTMTKIHRKHSNARSDGKPRVGLKEFIQATTPILCREPQTYMKALAATVNFEHPGNADSEGYFVTLLSVAERTRKSKLVGEVSKKWGTSKISKSPPHRRSSFGKSKRSGPGPRSKTPVRSNTKHGNTPKKIKREKSDSKDRVEDDAKPSAAHFVTSSLLNYLLRICDYPAQIFSNESGDGSDLGYDSGFLWAADILGILSDLVMAVPACATAIHKFRPSTSRGKATSLNHALRGSSSPPKTFVGFLLHSLIVQDRWSSLLEAHHSAELPPLEEKRKRVISRRAKVAQSAGRLLVALVARPGEGRRRVIAELVFALSGGQITTPSSSLRMSQTAKISNNYEMCALQSWGELCIGLVAPKSTGTSYDGIATLSFEVIRLMIESGMAHALLLAMHKVSLSHPRANAVVASLVLPFEVLSRPTVSDSLRALAEKERSTESASGGKSSKTSDTKDSANRHDSFADDHMLEEAFAPGVHLNAPRANAGPGRLDEAEDHEGVYEVMPGNADMEVVDDDENGMDIDGDVEVDEDDESEDDMSSETDSSEETSEEGSVNDDDDDDDDDDGEDETESMVEDDDDDSQGTGEVQEFLDPYRDDIVIDNGGFEMGVQGEDEEQPLDQGWTRVESGGFGGMVLGNRRSGVSAGLGNFSSRGIIDAAEAMIGTLLRNGDIQSGDDLEQMEPNLTVQVLQYGLGGGASVLRVNAPRDGNDDTNAIRNGSRRDILGSLPQIQQRSQPDVGFSALGGSGRWSDISSMEFIYGGPSVTAGSRNYDLVSRPETDNDSGNEAFAPADAPLFPGGPAAVAHSRNQLTLHPLLSAIELPPVNALASDLGSQDIRATRQIQATTRRPRSWTSGSLPDFLMPSTNRNSSRTNVFGGSNASAQNRVASNAIGWTDDGLPFDSAVEDFSNAFERALGEVMATSTPTDTSLEPTQATGTTNVVASEAVQNDGTDMSVVDASNPIDDANSIVENRETEPAHNDEENETSTPSAVESGGASAPSQDAEMAEAQAPSRSEENNEENNEHHHDGDQRGSTDDTNTGNEEEEDHGAVPQPNENGLLCPDGMDEEVFNSLPVEMQLEIVEQARATAELAAQLEPGSSLDLEALAALPEDMRREVIEQEQRERRIQAEAAAEVPADPANAEEMDNASFVASLSPELRREVLLTADSSLLGSLPASVVAEAQLLRDRARYDGTSAPSNQGTSNVAVAEEPAQRTQAASAREGSDNGAISRRKGRTFGKLRVDMDRESIVFLPSETVPQLSPPLAKADVVELMRFMFLLNPVRPSDLLQKLFQNICTHKCFRQAALSAMIALLHNDSSACLAALGTIESEYSAADWRQVVDAHFKDDMDDFPPASLIGVAPEVVHATRPYSNIPWIRRKQTTDTAASIAANIPLTATGSRRESYLPPAVAVRFVEALQCICKNSQRFCIEMLICGLVGNMGADGSTTTGFERLIDLLQNPMYSKSSANLEQLLVLLESAVSPLSHLPKHGDEDMEISQSELESAASQRKEWVDVPRISVSQARLQLLCSVLRMETCRDATFTKVNTIARRLCRVPANRGYVLAELASVARALGSDAIKDLKSLSLRMSHALSVRARDSSNDPGNEESDGKSNGGASSSVAVSTSTSELKLLRVLQTLQALCVDTSEDSSTKKSEQGTVFVTEELVELLRRMELDDLWAELSSCLQTVQALEGVKIEEESDKASEGASNEGEDENDDDAKKLQNNAVGLLTRFLPTIESFFVANASATRVLDKMSEAEDDDEHDPDGLRSLVGGEKLVQFVTSNKVLLNVLIRNNPALLDKGLRALVHIPRCRPLLDFDVKRNWFKTQMRRLRQQASRRYGNLRLHIRRQNVFEDAYHQLRLHTADEMRGRLHVTFRNEEGVDAGGLSREFFGILAKEIFNPNYALFTSTEDGSTFQPNPHSDYNPDHLSYFRFVGRIVGKAVSDGYLLDAHFTRSLYKHMLGIKPTHQDMEAIDPDYYKNLKAILEYNLGDLGLELTFAIEDHSFGDRKLKELIPGGSKIPVTEQNKEKYVSLVCQHRMTNAIASQINAYLDGFYELVSRDMISIFTPRELELLISGLPDIDVDDLKRNTDYVGWKATDTQIQWFWNVLFSLSRNEKAAFLQFVTGSSKVPLVGFGELPGMRGVQKFSIHKAGGSAGALMSAHTCFNSLDLPVYSSEEELKEKLLYAITEGGGTFMLA